MYCNRSNNTVSSSPTVSDQQMGCLLLTYSYVIIATFQTLTYILRSYHEQVVKMPQEWILVSISPVLERGYCSEIRTRGLHHYLIFSEGRCLYNSHGSEWISWAIVLRSLTFCHFGPTALPYGDDIRMLGEGYMTTSLCVRGSNG